MTPRGEAIGPFWVEVEFNRGPRKKSFAILTLPSAAGQQLHRWGRVLLQLADGRQMHGDVALVLPQETIVTLTHWD